MAGTAGITAGLRLGTAALPLAPDVPAGRLHMPDALADHLPAPDVLADRRPMLAAPADRLPTADAPAADRTAKPHDGSALTSTFRLASLGNWMSA